MAPTPTAISSPPFLELAKTWIAYIGVLAAAIIVAYGGIRKALKDLKSGETKVNDRAEVVAATLMENTTLFMWSDSNHAVCAALGEVVDRLESVVNCINFSTEATRDMSRDIGELRHQIERLRDKMP